MSSTPEPAVEAAPALPVAARHSLRLAWVSVALLPISFFAAMFLGEWLLSVQGYESGSTDSVPLGAALLAGIPALALLVAPTLPAIWFGVRAKRLGLPDGLVPAIIGAVILGVSVVQNVIGVTINHWPG